MCWCWMRQIALLDMVFRMHLDAVTQRLSKQRRTGALPYIPYPTYSYTTLFGLDALVLDKAGCLLDMGFGMHPDAVMQCLPKQRRTGALPFSLDCFRTGAVTGRDVHVFRWP